MPDMLPEKAELANAADNPKTAEHRDWLQAHPNFIPLVSIVISALTLLFSISSGFIAYGKLSEKVDGCAADIAAMQTDISEMNDEISGISNDVSALTARADAMEKNLDMLNQMVFCYRPTKTFASSVTKTYSGIDAPYSSGIMTVGAKTKIVYSENLSGQEFTAEQLADQTLLLPYIEHGKEVYFYGRVDETGSWDGHCIVNIYENNNLTLITDAQYDGGKLLGFRQAFPDSLPNGDDIWSISNRTMKDGFSEGETWRYFRDGSCTKDFTIDSVTVTDILDIDTFKLENSGTVEGYYSGANADGSYNDSTGNAYYVQYFRDGTVQTLYVGRFEKGNFQDATGNAWMLGKLSEGAAYSYYKGIFTNGKATKEKERWEEPLTVDRVKEIVEASGLEFSCELKWETDRV